MKIVGHVFYVTIVSETRYVANVTYSVYFQRRPPADGYSFETVTHSPD